MISDEYARTFDTYGAVVLPMMDTTSRADWEARMWKSFDEFPEYLSKGKHAQRVLGGFGGYGNPSSFHHPAIQLLRTKIKQFCAETLFLPFIKLKRWHLENILYECLYDRVCVRWQKFRAPTAENWHRDIYDGTEYKLRQLPATLPGNKRDMLCGGWLNLSSEDQFFVCNLGTHVGKDAEDAQEKAGGFAKISNKEVLKKCKIDLVSQQNKRFGVLTCDKKGRVVVPPGHILIFPQSLMHAVVADKGPEKPGLRLFFGHRITKETVPLFENLERVVNENAVPRIPSGQTPPMYSKNHYTWFNDDRQESIDTFRNWGKRTFKPQCLFERKLTTGNGTYFTPGDAKNNVKFYNNERTMPSLSAMGFDVYTYSAEHKSTLTPEPLIPVQKTSAASTSSAYKSLQKYVKHANKAATVQNIKQSKSTRKTKSSSYQLLEKYVKHKNKIAKKKLSHRR